MYNSINVETMKKQDTYKRIHLLCNLSLHTQCRLNINSETDVYLCYVNLTITARSHMLSWGIPGTRFFLCSSTIGEILLSTTWYSLLKTLQKQVFFLLIK